MEKQTFISISCERNAGVLQNTKQILISSSIIKNANIGIIPVLLYLLVLALCLAKKKSDSPEVSFSCLRITVSAEHSYTQIDKDVP